ncbi:MAG: ABC transporter ATP-binding protein [Cellulosilyticum sp.]|nr:ABC transporter ATP-binding protein [Cellulosilyticum sp.]
MEKYILQTRGLCKKYTDEYVVKHLDINVPKGKIYGLLGKNGAGKTTTMKMIMNLVQPTSGEILIFNKSMEQRRQEDYYRIGAMIEIPGFYSHLSAYENLEIIATLRGVHKPKAIESVLKQMGLDNVGKKKVGTYSVGMKQRLGMATALLHEPELLILDEPTNGLDPIGIRETREMLRSLCEMQGVSIIISSHILSEVEQLADYIGIMDKGKLLKELSIEEMRQLNRNYLELQVSDISKTLYILEHQLNIQDYKVADEQIIHLFSRIDESALINRQLIEHGIEVYTISPNKESLEDYFTKLTGGVNNVPYH